MAGRGFTEGNWKSPEGDKLREAARGHSKTPEHPEQAIRRPAKYRSYLQNSQSLVDRVIAHKERLFGERHKYRPRGATSAVTSPKAPNGEKVPLNRKNARAFLKMTAADVDDLDWWRDKEWSFLFYH